MPPVPEPGPHEPTATPVAPVAPAPVPAPRVGLASALATGAVAGLLGGLAAGAADAIWSWRPAAQFLDEPLARLRLIGFCACAYAMLGAALGAALAGALWGMLRGTRLGELLGFARAAHQARQQRDPALAVTGLALVLAGLPALAVAALLAHRLAVPVLARRNPDLVALAILGLGAGALLAAAPVALLVGRALELPLAALARSRRLAALASWTAPLWAAAGLIFLGGALTLARHWETARLLPLRPAAATLALATLTLAAVPAAGRARRWARGRRRWWGLAAAIVLALGLLRCGASPSVIKAATAYSGLGGVLAQGLRRAVDRDADGYSPLLGGGDCDDGDPRVHPGAVELPGDGVDQNCLAGDAAAPSPAADLRWQPRPPGVPTNANVLLVTIDTLRADHLGSYGYRRATSPALDRVAAEGTVFVNAWAHAPSTRYSMPAILTGRLPLDVAYDTSIEGWPGLAAEAITLAEVMKPAGLFTGAITNYWYFDAARGLAQGFDEYDNDNARLHTAVPGQGPAATRGSSSREQTDKALAFVQRHADQRWLLWVHYYDPHYEYEDHPGSPSFGAGRMDRYDGEIRYTDDQLGRLFEALRQRGLYDRTIIAITGDHGEGFGEHGVEQHGYHLYAPQTKVPLIVRVPGLPARRAATMAGHVDLLPTLANLVAAPGAGPPPTLLAGAMGQSLVDVLAGGPERERIVWQQLSYEGNQEHRGAVTRDCHVLYHASPVTSWEVYRIDRDPGETRDLEASDACAEPRAALARWVDSTSASADAAAALLPARPAVAAPLMLQLGTGARLLELVAPATARAGSAVELRWTFEARAPMPAGWKVFVHVEGPIRFTGDHAPPRPLEWWKPGQFLRYSTTLRVPAHAPAGKYTVWMGMWRGRSRQPARVVEGGPPLRIEQDRVAVATIEVVP